jgi:hypothetical protein
VWAPGAVVALAEELSQAAQHCLTAVLSWAAEAWALGGAVAQQGGASLAEVAVTLAWPEPQPQTAQVPPMAVPSWAVGEPELAGHSSPWVSAERMAAPVSASA